MTEALETDVLATIRDICSSKTRLSRLLALLEPTKTLARLFADEGASVIETRSCNSDMPHGGLFSYCSRADLQAQVSNEPGGSRDATPALPR